MKKSNLWRGLILVLVITMAVDLTWGRGIGGGGGFRGGGGGGGGFRGGGGGAPQRSMPAGGGVSGEGFRPSAPSRPASPPSRPNVSRPASPAANSRPGNFGDGGTGARNPNVVHRPQTGGPGFNPDSRPQIQPGQRPQIQPGGNITRPDFSPGTRPATRPGGEVRPGLPGGSGISGLRPGEGIRPGLDNTSLPGLRPARPGAGGASDRLPMTRPGEGGAGTRWTPADRGNISERHQDLNDRFNDLQEHWGDPGWHHHQWEGPNGTDVNHIGFWGPNGYWGHTGVWGPNGGHWGHTGAIGPNGAWGRTGYFGPAGHWSRSWGWYNGYGPAWGHGRWDYLWNEYPAAMALGATMWGLNVVDSMFGISNYSNPYYDSPVYVNNEEVVSYSQPIVGDPAYETEAATEAAAEDGTTATDANDPLTDMFNQARTAFYNEQFEQALALTNQALSLAPQDAAINEFRSLCLFALKQYREATATIHAVLAAGPGWDWTTLVSLYQNPQTYTAQLRDLEAAVNANSRSAETHFLLGYHYLTGGYQDAAVAQWKQVVKLQPDDKLAAQLVQMYQPPADTDSTAPQSPPPDLETSAYPLEKLYGSWTASAKESQFSLQLGDDDSFTWTFTQGNQPQSVSGVYTVRGNNLVMQPDTGGTMLSTITLRDDDHTLEFVPINNGQKLIFMK